MRAGTHLDGVNDGRIEETARCGQYTREWRAAGIKRYVHEVCKRMSLGLQAKKQGCKQIGFVL